jgi:hypothetical protein
LTAARIDRSRLAQLLGRHPRTIRTWLNDEKKPTKENLGKVISLLEAPVAERFGLLLWGWWLDGPNGIKPIAGVPSGTEVFTWDGSERLLRAGHRPDRLALLMVRDVRQNDDPDATFRAVPFVRRSTLQAEKYAIVKYGSDFRLAQQQAYHPRSRPRLLSLCSIGEFSLVARSRRFNFAAEEVEVANVAIEYVAAIEGTYSERAGVRRPQRPA